MRTAIMVLLLALATLTGFARQAPAPPAQPPLPLSRGPVLTEEDGSPGAVFIR